MIRIARCTGLLVDRPGVWENLGVAGPATRGRMLPLLHLAKLAAFISGALVSYGIIAPDVDRSVRTWLPSDEVADDDAPLLNADGCISRHECPFARDVFIDYAALGVQNGVGGEWITYDYDEVTRPLTPAQLLDEDELSLAVRLIVSEVGADRLLVNRNAALEAIGILYTVDNRMDPAVFNPEARPEAPIFPGCGAGGTFASCANPEQYLGMGTWRALNPAQSYDEAVLEQATDLAVTAWWLQEHGYVADFTKGATNYVHRCGDAAYGLLTTACDAHLGRPGGDVRGGNPHTGPIVFKAPGAWNASRGVYDLIESRQIEYDPWYDRAAGDAVADASELDVAPSRFGSPDESDPEGGMDSVVEGLTPVSDRALLQRILRK